MVVLGEFGLDVNVDDLFVCFGLSCDVGFD